VNRSITVGVVLRDNTFMFFRDGRPIGACVDNSRVFAVGHDVLGIFPQAQLNSAAPTSRVRLRNVEIYGGTG
jgi:hypothetical protein